MVAARRGALHRRGAQDLSRKVRQESAARQRSADQGKRRAGGEKVLAHHTEVREHTIPRETFHYKWDNSLPPAVESAAGAVVRFDTEEVTSGQLKQGDPAAKLRSLNFDKLYPLGGPVCVKGAEPGDVLEVEILKLQPGSWGWTALLPGLGLLAADFPDPYVRYIKLGSRT